MADSPRIEELRRRLHADPGSVAFAALAEEYRRSGRLREAVETCRAGLQRHPAYASAHVTLARALAALGRPAEACPHFEEALNLAPENLIAARSMAEVLKEMGRLREALQRFRQALALSPGDADLRAEVSALEREVRPPIADVEPGASEAVCQPVGFSPAVEGLQRFLAAIGRRRVETTQVSRETTGVR